MIHFRIARHGTSPGTEVVEVCVNGNMIAVIHPKNHQEIEIISAHFKGVGTGRNFADYVTFDEGGTAKSLAPSISIPLELVPYEIKGGKIVREI